MGTIPNNPDQTAVEFQTPDGFLLEVTTRHRPPAEDGVVAVVTRFQADHTYPETLGKWTADTAVWLGLALLEAADAPMSRALADAQDVLVTRIRERDEARSPAGDLGEALEAMTRERDDLATRVRVLSGDLERKARQHADACMARDAAMGERDDWRRQAGLAREERDGCERALERTRETLGAVRNAHTETRRGLSEAIEQRDDAQTRVGELERELADLGTHAGDLEADRDEARREVIEKMQEAASWEVLCLEKDELIEALRGHLTAVQAHLDDTRGWLHATTRPNLLSIPSVDDEAWGPAGKVVLSQQGMWIGSGDPDDQCQAGVVDRDGDLWRRQDDGLWCSEGLTSRTWDVLLANFGPLYPASVGQAAITDEPR